MPLDYNRVDSQSKHASSVETNDPGFNPTDYVGASQQSQQNEDLSTDYIGSKQQDYFSSDKQNDEDNAYLGITKQKDKDEDEDGLAKMLKGDNKEEQDEEQEKRQDDDIFANTPTKEKSTLEDVFQGSVKADTKIKLAKPKSETETKSIGTQIITKKPVQANADWRKKPVNVRQSGNIQEIKKKAWEREH
jgi:hypothetical protein